MIVKNEEEFLSDCLSSVKGAVDEIIVVDTGSSDRTIAIAKEHGAIVHHVPWENDFSKARNASLVQATGDWILVLDADERLADESIGPLRALVLEEPDHGYLLRIQNLNGKEDVIEHYLLRLFPNHPDLKYKGMIHEQIQGPMDSKFYQGFTRESSAQVTIIHSGYQQEILDKRNKHARNLDLIQLELAVSESTYGWFNLGQTAYLMGDYELAKTGFQKAITRGRQESPVPEFLLTAYTGLAQIFLDQKSPNKALELCESAHSACIYRPDFMLTFGYVQLSIGRPEAAFESFHRARLLAPKISSVSMDRGCTTWKPLVGMAQVRIGQKRYIEAQNYLKQANIISPRNPTIMRFMIEAGCR
jgi:glycosyltransferase involved in cell wall biosynthesis